MKPSRQPNREFQLPAKGASPGLLRNIWELIFFAIGVDRLANRVHFTPGLSEFYLLPVRHAARPRAGLFFVYA